MSYIAIIQNHSILISYTNVVKVLLLRIAFTQELCWEVGEWVVGHHFSVFAVLPYIISEFVQSDWN